MQLLDVCELIIDCEHKTAPTEESGYPSIRTPNIGRGYLQLENVNRVSEETYRLWTKRAVPQPGDLIMAREAPVGNVAMIPEGLQPCLGQRTLLIRPNKTKINSRYLTYLLLGDEVQGTIHAMTNGVTVPHLNMEDIRSLELPELPVLPVQCRIAGMLSAYDDLVENDLRRIRILEEMARALYREWFVDYRFPGHEKVPLVASPGGAAPQGWALKRLDEILELNYGKALKQDTRREGRFPVYGSSGIVGYHDRPLVAGPGIVVGRKGNVGSVYWSDTDFYPIDTTYFVSSSLPLRFLFYDLKTKNFINNDSAVPGLSRRQAYSLPTVVPPADLLDRYCELADGFQRQVSTLRRQVENLRGTRDLLLPRLLSGQLNVREQAG